MTTLNNAQNTAQQSEETQYAVFRDFNNVAMEARIQHVELKVGDNGEYVAITAISNLKDGEKGVAVRFTSSNGVLKLAKGGHLMPGRRVHLTGTLSAFETHYVNKDGVVVPLERGRLQLQAAQLKLGAKPKSQASA